MRSASTAKPPRPCVRSVTEIRLSKRRLAVSTHRKASMKAIVINENGGPEKVTLTEVDTPDPGPGQLQVAVETAGVNYLDIYQREGAIAAPFVAGVEGVGRVTKVGSDGDADWVGQRVGWLGGLGSFAETVALDETKGVAIPDDLSTDD